MDWIHANGSPDPASSVRWILPAGSCHLGVRQMGVTHEDGPWRQDQGPIVFRGEPADGNFGSPGKAWRINFRVADLEAMAAHLRSTEVEVTNDPEIYPNGRFAHLHDREGNSIELWQNGGTDANQPVFWE